MRSRKIAEQSRSSDQMRFGCQQNQLARLGLPEFLAWIGICREISIRLALRLITEL